MPVHLAAAAAAAALVCVSGTAPEGYTSIETAFVPAPFNVSEGHRPVASWTVSCASNVT